MMPLAKIDHRRVLRLSAVVPLAVGVSVSLVGAALPGAANDGADRANARAQCGLPAGAQVDRESIPPGTNAVKCALVGTVVRSGSAAVTVPAPGTAVGTQEFSVNGGSTGLQVEVSREGVMSFPAASEVSSGETQGSTTPGACSDGSYSLNDLKEYGTYDWWIGDGGMPAALSRATAQSMFADAINNITGSYNNCNYTDQVWARSSYKGQTSYETDMDSVGTCTARDGKSTWDAGNLKSGTVAQACWWSFPSPGVANDLWEADVRFNTHDYDFTNNPASCSGQYDVRSVGTHEAGHVFGLGHVGSGHSNLTMYTNSFTCTSKARTLGKGDILGLRKRY